MKPTSTIGPTEAVKAQIANDPELAAMLQDPSLSPEAKQQMLDQVVDSVMIELGFVTHDNLIIATDEPTPDGYSFYGYFAEENGQVYINDIENDSTRDLIETAGHEAAHAMDAQPEVHGLDYGIYSDNEIYAENFGSHLADYTDFALDFHGYDGLAMSNDHVGNDSSLVLSNNIDFGGLDKEQGDFRLTEFQLAQKGIELSNCEGNSCASLTELKYFLISSKQSVSEGMGAVSGLAEQLTEDIALLVYIDYILEEEPEKAAIIEDRVYTAFTRINEIADGDELTDAEAQQIKAYISESANNVYELLVDASVLDGEGHDASFGEGEKYGKYLASLFLIGKLGRYLKGAEGEVTDTANLTPDNFSRFDVDAEAGNFGATAHNTITDYLLLSSQTGVPANKLEEIVKTSSGSRPRP